MKKILSFVLLTTFLWVNNAFAGTLTLIDFVSPDDITISNLQTNMTSIADAVNSYDGSLIQGGTISADSLNNSANPEKRWADSFNQFVITGLLPPTTSGTLISTTTLGRALIKNTTDNKMKYVEKDATANTYTATKWTYVDLSSEGTYTYVETVIAATEPPVTANSIRLARVSTDSTQITGVTDKRITSITLSTSEDHYRSGFHISVKTPDSVVVSPGFLRHGTTNVTKTSNTTLTLGTAADWAGGVSGRAVSTYGFIVTDSSGNLRLTTTAPTLVDTSSNTTGVKRYSVIGGTNYRVIGWFYMNAIGSGNIDECGYSDFKDGDNWNAIIMSSDSVVSTTSTGYVNLVYKDVGQQRFYSTGRPVHITAKTSMSRSDAGGTLAQIISIDSVEKTPTEAFSTSETAGTAGGNLTAVSEWREVLGQGEHTIHINWKTSANTGYAGDRTLIIREE